MTKWFMEILLNRLKEKLSPYKRRIKMLKYNYRYVLLFDVTNCNPNGDASFGEPRVRDIDGRGIISEWCIKYKIKKIFFEKGEKVLHFQRDEDYTVFGEIDAYNKTNEKAREDELDYIDTRLFGSLDAASRHKDSRAVKFLGAFSIDHPMTIDPINIKEMAINRDFKVDVDEKGNNKGRRNDNKFPMVEYGLYLSKGGINKKRGAKMKVTDQDVELIFDAMLNMFEEDYSSTRPMGSMNIRKLIVWKSEERLPSPAKLLENVVISKVEGVGVPSSYSDYKITINSELPYKEYVM